MKIKDKLDGPFSAAWLIAVFSIVCSVNAHSQTNPVKLAPKTNDLRLQLAQATPSAPGSSPSTPAPAPIPVMPFDDALVTAATSLLSQVAGGASPSRIIVVDPLIDGMSGFQSKATRTMESMITELIRYKYPQLSVQKFTAAAVSKSPTVLVGTFTSINNQGQTVGTREAYRICLVLADLKSGKVIAKGTARSGMEGVDVTPTPYFRDSPAWSKEAATDSYIATCQATKPGDAISSVYIDGVLVNSLLSEAIAAYDNGRYGDALEFYNSALQLPAGNSLRVYNGLYLANLKLGRNEAANATFGKIIDYGLTNKRIAVKFLFKPGSTIFWPDRQISGPYPIWLREIAQRATQANACLEITGHTSPTGPEPINERLSQLRAEFIKQRLESESPAIGRRIIATGMGSRENFVGTGKDDMSDAIDRRVSFSVIPCQ